MMIIGQRCRYIFSCSPSARDESDVSLESFGSSVHVRCTGTALIMALMPRNRAKASRIISADRPGLIFLAGSGAGISAQGLFFLKAARPKWTGSTAHSRVSAAAELRLSLQIDETSAHSLLLVKSC